MFYTFSIFFCLQSKIYIPEFLSGSEITDAINASDSELALNEDEPDNADLLKKKL
jgi:hypothetical protein